MKFARSLFARFAAIAICAAFAAALPKMVEAAQPAPLSGTWTLNLNLSKFTPGPAPYKSLTQTFDGSGQMVAEGVAADGKPIKATYSEVMDGKPHPVSGMDNYDGAALTRLNDNSMSYIYTKRRNTVIVGSRAVSPDGLTISYSEQTYDDKGKPIASALMVFDKPGAAEARAEAEKKRQAAAAAPAIAAAVAATGLTPDETAAGAALDKGDNDQAIALFTKAIAANPTTMLYYDYESRGIAYAKKKQNDLAMADFDAAVKAKPDDADTHFRRGSLRLELMQYDGAIEDFSAAIEKDEMNATAYRLRGFAYNTLGKDKLAAPDYEKACSLNKDYCM